jgi:adenylyl-sulfate kinase
MAPDTSRPPLPGDSGPAVPRSAANEPPAARLTDTGPTAPEPRGFVVWLTGLSGSGKSTLSELIAAELTARRLPVELLDGDEVREFLSKGLGFSREDRDRNVLRIGYVATLLAAHGVIAIVAAISPYRDTRNQVRDMAKRFVEVHVDCALEYVEARDVKGLYARARRGEIQNFTGISDPYEPPESPEIRVDSGIQTVEESLALIMTWLEQHAFIPARTTA